MSNQVDHRAPKNAKNRRHNERPVPAMSCSGEGKNGTLGRRDWKLLSRRNERRNLKQGREASIGKSIKKTKPVRQNTTMTEGIEFNLGSGNMGRARVYRKNMMPRPLNPDTGEE
jgi:hypothetical protein